MDMAGELEATGRNVYLLQTSLERISKAARGVVDQWNKDPADLETYIQRLAKALASK